MASAYSNLGGQGVGRKKKLVLGVCLFMNLHLAVHGFPVVENSQSSVASRSQYFRVERESQGTPDMEGRGADRKSVV